jgi:hypothetical protein
LRIDQPAPLGFRLSCRLRKSPAGRWWYRRQWQRSGAAFLLSYPKAGRTWIRLLLGHALSEHYGLEAPFEDQMALDHLHAKYPQVPLIAPRHDDYPQLKAPAELVDCKDEYRDSLVILLARDLRDLAVSAYFQMSKRRGKFAGSLGEFLHGSRGGFETMLRFHNLWAGQRHQPRGFLLVRYEDVKEDTCRELRRMVDFLGLAAISDATLAGAAEYASFENMRRRETEGGAGRNRLDGGSAGDPESLKTRKGRVGGFAEYMTAEDAAWTTGRLVGELDPMYGYPYEPGKTAPGVK